MKKTMFVWVVIGYDRCNGSVKGWGSYPTLEEAQTYLNDVVQKNALMVFWITQGTTQDWNAAKGETP